jgi:hypothetical protein
MCSSEPGTIVIRKIGFFQYFNSMKALLVLLLLISALYTNAAIKETISSGSWFNPSIWSPAGVPLLEDTVVINHAISVTGNYVDFGASWLIVNQTGNITGDTTFALHGNLKLYGQVDMSIFAVGDGDSTLVYGTVLGRKYIPGNPHNFNMSGTISSDSLVLGDRFENYGLINVQTMIVGGPQMINRTGGAILTSAMAIFGGVVTNEAGAIMNHTSLLTSENIINNGDISCMDWTHSQGTASGNTGKYCISNCFINVSTIQGALDVCDSSPGGFCDMNMGTIAGTITSCVQSPCSTTIGLQDELESESFLYPNPVKEILCVQATNVEPVKLYSALGNLLWSMEGKSEYAIPMSCHASGIYYVSIGEKTLRVIKE